MQHVAFLHFLDNQTGRLIWVLNFKHRLMEIVVKFLTDRVDSFDMKLFKRVLQLFFSHFDADIEIVKLFIAIAGFFCNAFEGAG